MSINRANTLAKFKTEREMKGIEHVMLNKVEVEQ